MKGSDMVELKGILGKIERMGSFMPSLLTDSVLSRTVIPEEERTA
jgi:hypothetical protein